MEIKSLQAMAVERGGAGGWLAPPGF